MDDAHFRRLERLYEGAPINARYRPRLLVAKGEAEVAFAVREEFHHAAGAAHGSIAFKALDDAAFFAANSLVPDVFVLTAQFNVNFLRPIARGDIVAKGRVVHAGRRQLLAEAVAFDAEGREVARGSGIFVPSTLKLDDLAGAR